jgi:transcriptional regulator with PAS, ATPase and Fis domain
MRTALDRVMRLGPSDVPVLLTGETGTGKDLLAHALHQTSPRRSGPFIPLNCGAIPEHLYEAELFGHSKGAYTGADSDTPGLLESAHNGTLFLDEVGDIPGPMQVVLLRFLDHGEVRRLGQVSSRHVNVRVIAATNRALSDDMRRGHYRADLYFRLKVGTCHVPPLRDRLEDLEALVAWWISKLSPQLAPQIKGVTPAAFSVLRAHSWPGNVRELRNAIEQALLMAEGELITERDLVSVLDAEAATPDPRTGPATSIATEERDRLLAALNAHRWNRDRTAASLGMSRSTLWRRLSRYGLRHLTTSPR